MRNIYLLSSATGSDRVPTFASAESGFGGAHYSWAINAQLYLDGLKAIRDVDGILAPDIYQHDIAYKVAALGANVTHLIDKPIELLRPMFGRKNVAITVWEFAEYSDTSFNGDPRTNQLHMLRQMDDVWCGSSFTQRSLTAVGIKARVLPPPVAHFFSTDSESIDAIPCVTLDTEADPSAPNEVLGELIASANDRPIFVAVLAPYDLRKNVRALIEGFLASEAGKKGILLIKLVLDNHITTVANINQILLEKFGLKAASKNVVFCGAYLTERQMNRLYGLSSFFVSAASAEGLNLPLIEAMGRGVPAISPDHTAMGDYISKERAIVVPSSRQPTKGHIHALADHLATTHYPPSKDAVAASFDRAIELDASRRVEMGKRGASFVTKYFGLKAFEKRVTDYESNSK